MLGETIASWMSRSDFFNGIDFFHLEEYATSS